MITVSAIFTKDSGDPATGLTLTDIDIYLYRRAKSDGTVTTVWNGENPTEEVGGGIYTKAYASDDPATYDYFAFAQYTGATELDSNYALMSAPFIDESSARAGATAFTYTLTSSVDAAPIANAQVWITTDASGDKVIASGVTDSSGQVTFYLNAGTYYVWRQKAGWNFSNPDTETVS